MAHDCHTWNQASNNELGSFGMHQIYHICSQWYKTWKKYDKNNAIGSACLKRLKVFVTWSSTKMVAMHRCHRCHGNFKHLVTPVPRSEVIDGAIVKSQMAGMATVWLVLIFRLKGTRNKMGVKIEMKILEQEVSWTTKQYGSCIQLHLASLYPISFPWSQALELSRLQCRKRVCKNTCPEIDMTWQRSLFFLFSLLLFLWCRPFSPIL